jgi:hypothetical protein
MSNRCRLLSPANPEGNRIPTRCKGLTYANVADPLDVCVEGQTPPRRDEGRMIPIIGLMDT